jgi:hypothetical protein
LSVLNGETTWDALGLVAMDYELVVFVPADGVYASQTLLGVVGLKQTIATPEPATMLIFGLGVVATAPYLRRRKG